MRKEVEKEESKLTKVGLLEVTDMSLILSLKLNKKKLKSLAYYFIKKVLILM